MKMDIKLLAIFLSLLLLTACASSYKEPAVEAKTVITPISTPTATQPAATSTAPVQPEQLDPTFESCPVTLPLKQPFVPPQPYPTQPPGPYVWNGTESLWTALPPDGIFSDLPHNPTGYTQKLLWWRVGYVWTEEPKPALQVSGYRLDDPTVTLLALPATNAFAPDIQSAMLVGVDFPTAGCWEITGRYADAVLSYVVWVEP